MGGRLGAGLCAPTRPGSWELLKTPSRRACFLSGVRDLQGVGWAGDAVSQGQEKQLSMVPAPVGLGSGGEPLEGAE